MAVAHTPQSVILDDGPTPPGPRDSPATATIGSNPVTATSSTPAAVPPPSSVPTSGGNMGAVFRHTDPVQPDLNPRSCVTCRRRKVRCDKRMPCGNCRRAAISCVFPAPGRTPRRPKAPKDPSSMPHQGGEGGSDGGAGGRSREQELLKRLRKLESIVEELSGQVELEQQAGAGVGGSVGSGGGGALHHQHRSASGHASPGNTTMPDSTSGAPGSSSEGQLQRPLTRTTSAQAAPAAAGATSSLSPSRHVHDHSSMTDINRQFGRLVLNEPGRTRYVSSVFWSRINDELNQLREETEMLTEEESEEDSDAQDTPQTAEGPEKKTDNGPRDHHAFIFGYRSADVDLRPLHPLPSQMPFIWQVYVENVDPLVKILHKPTMEKLIRDMRVSLDVLTPGTEALMFSIYYAAITSMEADEVKVTFGNDKESLLSQYRFALEQALAKANFLNTSEMVVLQAFVLFLILVRRHDDTRFTWTLTGLAIRIAQSMGIQRDGTNFPKLSVFEIEMRRRLWWAICVLDLRSAEDQGTELTINDTACDTQLPLNINDSDIDPDSQIYPRAREGPTDLTFCLIRYEICNLARRLHSMTTAMSASCQRDLSTTVEQREAMLAEVYQRVETKYLRNVATVEENPMFWVAATISRLILAKMTLMLYQPVLFQGQQSSDVPEEVRDRLLMSSIEIVEYNQVLNNEPRCRQWRWLFQTYTQWHAIAYILVEISRRPWTPTMERGWTALNVTFSRPTPQELAKMAEHSTIWLPLRSLFAKARRHRDAELAQLRADPDRARRLDAEERTKVPRARFGVQPSVRNHIVAHEQWHRLVGVSGPPLEVSELPARSAPGGRQDSVTAAGMGLHTQRPPPSLTTAQQKQPKPQEQVHGPQNQTSDATLMNEAMQYMDNILHAQTFDMRYLMSVAFDPDVAAHPDIASQVRPGGGSAASSSTPLAPTARQPSVAQPPSSEPSHKRQKQQHQQFASSDPLADDPNAAIGTPSLWTDDISAVTAADPIGAADNALNLADGDGVSGVTGEPASGSGVEEAPDLDIGMDLDLDDFNWQSWQQSIAGFEMETGLGTAQRGAWSCAGGL